jgi:predicted transcriptional regulator of viral defense system
MEAGLFITSIKYSVMDNLIAKLYQSPKTILTTRDLALVWEETNPVNLKSKIGYYAKQGALIRLTRGVFAKGKNYNPKELATSIYIPSYISFETVLREAGIIFQHYDTIFVAGPWPLTKKIDRYTFTFRKLKDVALFNSAGIVNQENYSIATPERAFLDMMYLFPKYYFDNLKSINWEQCGELVKIYDNQQLVKRLIQYKKRHAQ